MDLFDISRQQQLKKEAPLAVRMRPRSLDEFVGQEDIVGPGKLLRRAIEADQLSSVIFYGPPGTGKTTLARVIANSTKAFFEQLNAVTSGVGDIRQVTKNARDRLGMYAQRTILFIDEIHRFNKSQQDALLPFVEDGTIILIGATTENPFFEVNAPLLSRSRIFAFHSLKDQDLAKLIERALADEENGLGKFKVDFESKAREHIIHIANGDARSVLNAVELAVVTTPPGEDGVRHITLEVAAESIQSRVVKYDKSGDNHYDVISAFIKSIRGSDPDGALYWLAMMLYAGEDIKFIARRLTISAAEDIGLADPHALVLANAGAQSVERIGMPEARIILAEMTVYLALAPKSNSAYLAVDKALHEIRNGLVRPVPLHLRNDEAGTGKGLGYGVGYKYPHNFQEHWVPQEYLPPELKDIKFYQPAETGQEKELIQKWPAKTKK